MNNYIKKSVWATMRFKTALAVLKFHRNAGGRGEEPQPDPREGVQEEDGIPI